MSRLSPRVKYTIINFERDGEDKQKTEGKLCGIPVNDYKIMINMAMSYMMKGAAEAQMKYEEKMEEAKTHPTEWLREVIADNAKGDIKWRETMIAIMSDLQNIDNQIVHKNGTVTTKDIDIGNLRSILTEVSLEWHDVAYDKEDCLGDNMSLLHKRIKNILKLLEIPAYRRDYLDKPVIEYKKWEVQDRLKDLHSDKKFRIDLDDMIARMHNAHAANKAREALNKI